MGWSEVMSEQVPDLAAAVLAGGASARMGRDKALLTLDGARLIERVVGRLRCLSEEILVVTNHAERYDFLAGGVRFVPDVTGPGQGPLAGIASALEAAQAPRVLVVATDMPFLNVPLLRYLATLDRSAEVVVPILAAEGFPETLHAIYSKGALPAIQAQLTGGQRKITSFFPQVRVREVPREALLPFDPSLRSFFNANTPEEWAEAMGQEGE